MTGHDWLWPVIVGFGHGHSKSGKLGTGHGHGHSKKGKMTGPDRTFKPYPWRILPLQQLNRTSILLTQLDTTATAAHHTVDKVGFEPLLSTLALTVNSVFS